MDRKKGKCLQTRVKNAEIITDVERSEKHSSQSCSKLGSLYKQMDSQKTLMTKVAQEEKENITRSIITG